MLTAPKNLSKRKDEGNDRARRGEEKWQACWCLRDQRRACTMVRASAEELAQTGAAEREWLQRHKVTSWEERQCRLSSAT